MLELRHHTAAVPSNVRRKHVKYGEMHQQTNKAKSTQWNDAINTLIDVERGKVADLTG